VNRFVRMAETIPILSHSEVYCRLNRPSDRVADLTALKHSELAFLP